MNSSLESSPLANTKVHAIAAPAQLHILCGKVVLPLFVIYNKKAGW